jgi:very-short-patch-repair endonuclease
LTPPPSDFKEGAGGWLTIKGIKYMLHNRPILKARRKELRNNATPAEQQLWSALKHSNLDGCKFRRQHSVGPYILDFYCPAERLAIELDGDSHFTDEAIAYDRERTAYLNGLGIKVIRFLNTDAHDHIEAVCESILLEIKG